ncbi:MAG TPA: CRTAC1 family protein [Planctomycetaceae bacterium]|nr:CRTAC1 family protein [Planctomycetaceae bacterium]
MNELSGLGATLLCALSLLAVGGCGPRVLPTERVPASPERHSTSVPAARAPADADWFEDVTSRTGIDFAYRNGREGGHYTILETVGGGAAVFDYDGDGDLDIFIVGGGDIGKDDLKITGRSGRLYRNDGDWKFADVTAGSGLDAAPRYSHGCAVADYDRDGAPDLLVTGYGGCSLYRNLGGGRFQDVAQELGLPQAGWFTAAAWGDIDHDGRPDLYLASYLDWKPDPHEWCGNRAEGLRDVCPPQDYHDAPDRLFRNAEGRFEDITAQAGLRTDGKGLGVVAADLNLDGWLDFYVANDAGPNFLYLGQPDLHFEEVGLAAGVAMNELGAPEGSMGVDCGDFDGDGLPDIFVANFELEDNSLYRNLGQGRFVHATTSAGLGGIGRLWVGFGAGFVDFDTDGWLDLYVSNGNVYYRGGQSDYLQPPLLLQNDRGRFRDASSQAAPYFSTPHAGRGVAAGDLDGDGAPDLVFVHQNDPVVILRNRRTPAKWLGVRLQGTRADREAIGARLIVRTGERELVRFVRSGAGYLSQSDHAVRFPLAADQASAAVDVVWPGNHRERFAELQSNRVHLLTEGEGEPVAHEN